MSILEKGGFGTGAEVGTYRSSVRGALAAVRPYALLNMRAIEDIYAVAGAGGCKAAGGLKCKYARPSTKKGHMYDYEINRAQKGAGRHKVGPAPSTGAVTSFEVAVLSCAVGWVEEGGEGGGEVVIICMRCQIEPEELGDAAGALGVLRHTATSDDLNICTETYHRLPPSTVPREWTVHDTNTGTGSPARS
ncbi:hypothetical protein C8R43DRAFT_954757 [Mycena crocata]|nr:hypothetical protein C8R43DRAFT_957636 [Mycena crocata]KAJ7141798.1 hypothetical protein C8R43DRAFT_954757 [Mycena crocata]